MISRDDFIFTVGYQGDTAIVDARAKKRHKGLATAGLLEAGLYKQAFCAALFDKDDQAIQQVLEAYNRHSDAAYTGPEELKRVFGVDGLREDIHKTKAL